MTVDGGDERDKPNLQGNNFAAERRTLGLVGNALILVAILGGLANLGLAAVGNALLKSDRRAAPPARMSRDEQEAWQRGQDTAPALNICGTCFLSLVYIPVLLGGVKLQSGTGRGVGMTAAVLAMFPCSLAFPLGVPVGIWALVVLNRPEVIAAMATPAPRKKPRRIDDDDDYNDEWDNPPRRDRRGNR